MSEEPAIVHDLLLTVADRLLATQEIVEDLMADPVQERLVRLLLRLSSELGDVPLRLTHDEVARLIGSTRQTVTTILGMLHSEGVVAVRPRSIVILDKERLAQRLQGGSTRGQSPLKPAT